MSEDRRTAAIYAAMRIPHPHRRPLDGRHLRAHHDRHRRRTEHRERPLDLFEPSDEHEADDEAGQRAYIIINR